MVKRDDILFPPQDGIHKDDEPWRSSAVLVSFLTAISPSKLFSFTSSLEQDLEKSHSFFTLLSLSSTLTSRSNKMVSVSRLALAAIALTGVTAHPGEKHDPHVHKREMALRRSVAASTRRALDACAGSAADVALKQRAIQRREAKLKELRAKRAISATGKFSTVTLSFFLADMCLFFFSSDPPPC